MWHHATSSRQATNSREARVIVIKAAHINYRRQLSLLDPVTASRTIVIKPHYFPAQNVTLFPAAPRYPMRRGVKDCAK